MWAKCLRGEQSLTLSRLRGCRMWVEGEEGRSENEDDGAQECRPLQTIANAHKRKMRRQKRTGKYCLKSLKVWNVSSRVWVKGIGEGMRTLVICENNNALLCITITWNYPRENRFLVLLAYTRRLIIGWGRVAELGSLSSGAKIATKIFVKRVFTIFATNASFLRVISNFRI